MLPLTGVIFSIGKIITPIGIEIEYRFFEIGVVYFTFFVISMISLILTIILSTHFHSPPSSLPLLPQTPR